MKWPKTKQTENEGVLHVQSVVNEQGSIFRPVHGETDVDRFRVDDAIANEPAGDRGIFR